MMNKGEVFTLNDITYFPASIYQNHPNCESTNHRYYRYEDSIDFWKRVQYVGGLLYMKNIAFILKMNTGELVYLGKGLYGCSLPIQYYDTVVEMSTEFRLDDPTTNEIIIIDYDGWPSALFSRSMNTSRDVPVYGSALIIIDEDKK